MSPSVRWRGETAGAGPRTRADPASGPRDPRRPSRAAGSPPARSASGKQSSRVQISSACRLEPEVLRRRSAGRGRRRGAPRRPRGADAQGGRARRRHRAGDGWSRSPGSAWPRAGAPWSIGANDSTRCSQLSSTIRHEGRLAIAATIWDRSSEAWRTSISSADAIVVPEVRAADAGEVDGPHAARIVVDKACRRAPARGVSCPPRRDP